MKTLSSLECLEPRIAPSTLIVANLNDSGAGSLRAAIAASHDGDVINFKTGLAGYIHVKSDIAITDSITINGAGKITLDGGGAVQLLEVNDGNLNVLKTVNLNGLIFRNGFSGTVHGGAILDAETLNITDCIFKGNTSKSSGGAIAAENDGSLSVINSTFSNNWADVGGAIAAAGTSDVLIKGSYFSGNSASSLGGAFAFAGGWGGAQGPAVNSLKIVDSQFYKNTCSYGGAGWIQTGDTTTVSISGSSFSTNQAPGVNGGPSAIAFGVTSHSSVTLSNSIFENNISHGNTGALGISSQGSVVMNSCTVKNNTGANYGGGIYFYGFDGGSMLVKNSTILGNKAALYGGGIWLQHGTMTLDHTLVRANTAALGAGIYNEASLSGGTLNLIASIINGNTPDQIYVA